MIKFYLFWFISLLITTSLISQEEFIPGELWVHNRATITTDVIKVDLYPVGIIFNGDKDYKHRSENFSNFQHYFIVGGYKENMSFGQTMAIDFDEPGGNEAPDGLIGYGKYRIDFYKRVSSNPDVYDYVNYCYVDFGHSNYPWAIPPNGMIADMTIIYKDENTIKCWDDLPLPPDRVVKIWDQRVRNPSAYEIQNINGFKTTNSDNGVWLNFPQIATDYGGTAHETPGKMFLNMNVLSAHQPFVMCNQNYELEEAKLILNAGFQTVFTVGNAPGSNCNASFINNQGGTIAITANTTFIVEHGGKLFLESGSQVIFNNTGKLIMKNGSYYCNRGGTIGNFGNFIIQKGVQFCLPDPPARFTCYVQDSASLILETGADFVIPDSTTYIFEGIQSAFIINDSTTVKFGKNSKLIFQYGAKISANGCKFISYDSTETWDGIYLDGIAYDTLKNCTFQNAVNGINITDNYNSFGSPGAVEISNCTFKNSTGSDLLNYVYVNNSYNVLVKGCNAEKTSSGGFTSGIIAEYCPANGVVIADNNINYVTTGISLLQSSEYIGRNTITGSTNSGTGIYLDNSNGTIEHNTVNNFQKSVYGSYSSP